MAEYSVAGSTLEESITEASITENFTGLIRYTYSLRALIRTRTSVYSAFSNENPIFQVSFSTGTYNMALQGGYM
jgi:hypothetical protein